MSRLLAAICGAAFMLGGCSFTDEALLPSLAGESPPPQPPAPAQQAVQPQPVSSAPASPTAVQTAAVPTAPISTLVGQKAAEMRSEYNRVQGTVDTQAALLEQLRVQSVQSADGYHNTVAAINSKLQVGTTKGNPILVQQWGEAQTQLQQVSNDLASMNSLSADIGASATLVGYLLESTRASYEISGAVDEDHLALNALEDDLNRSTVQIDRLLNEATVDIARQTTYLATERSNLTALSLAIANGEAYGSSLATRIYQPAAAPASLPGAGIASGRPLVVIRFDQPHIPYEQPLYEAVSKALERQPTAAFDIVAVAPLTGSPADLALNTNTARRNAEEVLRSLTAMGLPPDRISMSERTSQTAETTEVHLYVR